MSKSAVWICGRALPNGSWDFQGVQSTFAHEGAARDAEILLANAVEILLAMIDNPNIELGDHGAAAEAFLKQVGRT